MENEINMKKILLLIPLLSIHEKMISHFLQSLLTMSLKDNKHKKSLTTAQDISTIHVIPIIHNIQNTPIIINKIHIINK